MERDYSAEVDEVTKILAQMGEDLKLNFSGQMQNREMTDLVNAYKKEEMEWYNSSQITENAFQTTTQNLWYLHYLNKIRLAGLGLRAKYNYYNPTGYRKEEHQKYPVWKYKHDGKNLLCTIEDTMHYEKAFYHEGNLVWKDSANGQRGEYNITQSRSLSGKYICPNCGYEDTLENLVDGCEYCQTKFQIEDFNQKVSSVYIPGDSISFRDGLTTYKNFNPKNAYFFLGALVFCILIPGGIFLLPLMIVGYMIYSIKAFSKTMKDSMKSGPAKTADTIKKIKETDPNFSEESFIGNLTNKLTSVCYADKAEEIQPFVEGDFTDVIQRYRRVIDCKLIECALMDYHTDNEYEHLDVRVKMKLASYIDEQISQGETNLNLTMIRSKQAVTRNVNIYRCDHCSASVSLLNGGVCEYCGSPMNLKEYDWVFEKFDTE